MNLARTLTFGFLLVASPTWASPTGTHSGYHTKPARRSLSHPSVIGGKRTAPHGLTLGNRSATHRGPYASPMASHRFKPHP